MTRLAVILPGLVALVLAWHELHGIAEQVAVALP